MVRKLSSSKLLSKLLYLVMYHYLSMLLSPRHALVETDPRDEFNRGTSLKYDKRERNRSVELDLLNNTMN